MKKIFYFLIMCVLVIGISESITRPFFAKSVAKTRAANIINKKIDAIKSTKAGIILEINNQNYLFCIHDTLPNFNTTGVYSATHYFEDTVKVGDIITKRRESDTVFITKPVSRQQYTWLLDKTCEYDNEGNR